MNLYDRPTPPMGSRIVALESDEALRERLLYIAGDGEAAVRRISMARGRQLDDIAESVGLKRRTS